jgi:hypothetical protein
VSKILKDRPCSTDGKRTTPHNKADDFILISLIYNVLRVQVSRFIIIINMSNNRSSYSYYDYIKNYDSKWLGKYQSGTHWWAGRG